jgi:hypothetical protein
MNPNSPPQTWWSERSASAAALFKMIAGKISRHRKKRPDIFQELIKLGRIEPLPPRIGTGASLRAARISSVRRFPFPAHFFRLIATLI